MMTTGPLADIEVQTGATPQLQPRQHLLFCQGDECEFIYIVKDGWVLLYEILEDGRKQILKFAERGSVIGFMPPGERHMTHTAECLTTVVLSAISRCRFERVLRERSDLAMWVAGNAVRDLEAAFRRLTSVGRGSARERVAHLLIELAGTGRSNTRAHGNDSAFLLPSVTRQQIGDALGLSSEHISRVFRGFKDEHLIATHHNRLRVTDFDGLADIAGMAPEAPVPHRGVPGGVPSSAPWQQQMHG